MYVTKVPNRNSPPAILIRESYREDGKVRNRTVANISKLPKDTIELIRLSLAGKTLTSPADSFEIVSSFHHGNVQAVLSTMRRLGFSKLIASRRSEVRDIVVAMVAARILQPSSKLATIRSWQITSLPNHLGLGDISEDKLYGAMDWLLDHQNVIEQKLAARHMKQDSIALYDLTSSYFEGYTCPLAARGHNRDKKSGKLQVNYGLLTDSTGRPISVSVFKGNVGDPKTLLPQIEKATKSFGLERLVMVGDRGMITQKQIDVLQTMEGMDWITALRPDGVKKLVEDGPIQMGLFDIRNLFEVQHDDYPGERLVACLNPEMKARRSRKRKSLIQATCDELDKVKAMVNNKPSLSETEISRRVKSILKGYRIRKYCQVTYCKEGFEFKIETQQMLCDANAYGKGDPKRAKQKLSSLNRYSDVLNQKLLKLQDKLSHGRLHGKDNIGVRVGRVINKYKVAKHFDLNISNNAFDYSINQEAVSAEAALDGIYVVRTSLPEERMSKGDAVRSYKMLSQVERAFRSFKSINLMVRPIYHRTEERVRAHIFLSMLAYYVQYHMFEAWRPLLFADEDQASKSDRDPVARAQRSGKALKKVHTKKLFDGSVVHSFHTLLQNLSSIVLNVCRPKQTGPNTQTFEMITTPTQKQKQALDLLGEIKL